MKNIGIFFTEPKPLDSPFDKPEYFKSYQELGIEVANLGASYYIVRSPSTYLGDGLFSNSWQFVDGKFVETGKVKIDVLYNRGKFISDHTFPVLNTDMIDSICANKWLTYKYFSQYCPYTLLVMNETEFIKALKSIQTEKKVIKPIDGSQGEGIFIGKDDHLMTTDKKYPFLLQEFLDSSAGIPNIVGGLHDLRIVLINEDIGYCFVRTPPQGGLLANVALGGTLTVISAKNIPPSAMALAKNIDEKMKKFGNRIYGVDMALTSQGYKIIELNSKLGLQENKRHSIFVQFKKKLAKLLLSVAESQN